MCGYDISWAGFNIIEVMASTKFTEKRVGYLSASQCFHKDTEVLMLSTNMIRKDLNSQSIHEPGVALSSLSCFMSADLARDLTGDILSLLTSTKPYVRKKAVLILYKVIFIWTLYEFIFIQKDLNSQSILEPGVALSSLSCFMSADLARDLSGDIFSLLPSTKPYVRKKAVLILYKVIFI